MTGFSVSCLSLAAMGLCKKLYRERERERSKKRSNPPFSSSVHRAVSSSPHPFQVAAGEFEVRVNMEMILWAVDTRVLF